MPLDVTPHAQPIVERPGFVAAAGWIGLLGTLTAAVLVVVADVVVPEHDWIADTISDLAAGRMRFLADIGLYAFAAALMACAVGSAHAHLGGWGWSFGVVCLAALSLVVFMVGVRDEYGDGDDEGVVIHVYLVYALGALFAAAPWAMSAGAVRESRAAALVCRAVTVLWVPLAPVFFFVPDGWDGLYERMLAVVAGAFVVAIAWVLVRRARRL